MKASPPADVRAIGTHRRFIRTHRIGHQAICTIAAMAAAATEPGSAGPRLGVLAFGDSITNGGGELQWGVALQSWALWTARSLGLPYSGYAVDGAGVANVTDHQIPAFLARAGDRAPYDIGCLYVGVNDVRRPDWDPASFAAGHARALGFLAERCDRVLVVTAPLRLGRPPADAKVPELDAIVERAAADHGALVVDLRDFGARNHVMVDRVHPTAFGQIAIAERALAALADDGLTARVAPASLIAYETTRWQRLRGDWTYVYRDAKQRARAAIARRR
jgi:lysophospholipase L1-like esterase